MSFIEPKNLRQMAHNFSDAHHGEVLGVDDDLASGGEHALPARPEEVKLRRWCRGRILAGRDAAELRQSWSGSLPPQRRNELRAIHFARGFAGGDEDLHGRIVTAAAAPTGTVLRQVSETRLEGRKARPVCNGARSRTYRYSRLPGPQSDWGRDGIQLNSLDEGSRHHPFVCAGRPNLPPETPPSPAGDPSRHRRAHRDLDPDHSARHPVAAANRHHQAPCE
jgi:hypothetical protein